MCGILGIIDNLQGHVPVELVASLAQMMHARGPDGGGDFFSGPVGMAMRRLSVIDLAGGWQPLYSRGGRVVAFQNGEIYNHQTLRRQLEVHGHRFLTRSDTEVLAHGYTEWGADGLIEKLDGMFAIAILDLDRRELHLARDRMGEKPLFYTKARGRFAYASDLRVLAALPWVDLEVSIPALDRYLALHYVPGNSTIFRSIERLLPGERAVVSIDDMETRRFRYYQPPLATVPVSDEELRENIENAVESRLLADVPAGIFLSGGLDSSILAAVAKQSGRNIATYSMGFRSEKHDEGPYAVALAAALGLEHHLFQFDDADFDSLLPKVAAALDEPIGDQALLPLYWLCQEARQHVTVVLSGEGADEVFGGYGYYDRHRQCAAFHSLANNPGNLTPSGFPLLTDALGRVRLLEGAAGEQCSWEAKWMAWLDQSRDSLQRATAADITTWLPDDLLVKFDRMTMAHSLEGRAPYLAPAVVANGLGLPPSQRQNGAASKVALRRIAARWLPPEILARPKQGFVLPMRRWLKQWFDSRGPVTEYFREHAIPGLNIAATARLVQDDLLCGIQRERLLLALVLLVEWYGAFMRQRSDRLVIHRNYDSSEAQQPLVKDPGSPSLWRRARALVLNRGVPT